jgi:hypothetical protein
MLVNTTYIINISKAETRLIFQVVNKNILSTSSDNYQRTLLSPKEQNRDSFYFLKNCCDFKLLNHVMSLLFLGVFLFTQNFIICGSA